MFSKSFRNGRLLLLLLLPFLFAPQPCLSETALDAPFQVWSSDAGRELTVEIASVIDFPFDEVDAALTDPEAWCEFIPLVFNIKACILANQEGRTLLTFYIARRFHDPAEQAFRLQYEFDVPENEADRTHIHLFAPRGPHGTRDYVIDLEIRRAGHDRTELHFQTSFRPSFRSRIATRAYLSGAGRDKVGFSVERYEDGKPVYVGGVKGAIERNAMRYFLALDAFLDTMHLPEEVRYEGSLQTFFDATERYPRQLRERGREEYLEAKMREREVQLELQERIE
jgi:hypothetical protein